MSDSKVAPELSRDIDSEETGEWLDALEAVIDAEGVDRAHFLIENLLNKARSRGSYLPYNANTPYVNTIPVDRQPHYPGDREIERRISSIIRWNALATVVKANKESHSLGGHIASFQSAATLYDIGFGHFWRAPTGETSGDLIYIQGHSSPGIYARAFVEGRLTEDQLLHFRQEVDGKGLSSYPHPWLMPDFWQFPTVSMGLGPITAIYQARFMKYLEGRGLADMGDRKVWAFMGDGEMDELESRRDFLAAREKLDNPIFRSQLQPAAPLCCPVRGNGKIIQELGGEPAAPVGMSSRCFGVATGMRCWSATSSGFCASGWKNASTASIRPSRRATAHMFARNFSRSIRS